MWLCTFAIVGALCSSRILNVSAKYIETSNDRERDKAIYQKYIELDKNVKELVDYGAKMVLPYIMEANEHLNLSSSCSRDMLQLILGIRKLKISALRFLDATAKLPEGIMTGNTMMLGDYDECMNTFVTRRDGSIAFKGQYCMIFVKPLLPTRLDNSTITNGHKGMIDATKNASEVIQFAASVVHYAYDYPAKFGLCVPSGCSSADIDTVLKYVGERLYVMDAKVAYCDQEYDIPLSTGKLLAIIFFSLAGLLAIIGSSVDYYFTHSKKDVQSRGARYLLCFSIQRNFPKVISTKISHTSLTSVFGVRVLSLFYVVLLHQYFCHGTVQVEGHLFQDLQELPTFFMQIIVNGVLTVEVFFFMGGLVNAYTRVKINEIIQRKIGILEIIIHRLWRIYPAYIFCMLSLYLLFDTHGPVRTLVKQEFGDNCDKYWWHNILFINNFLDESQRCVTNAWYVAADTHLFLISLFTVPLLLRSPKKGIILHLGILVAAIVGTAVFAWHKELLPALIVYRPRETELKRYANAYSSTLPHIAPYFAGILTGYMLAEWKDLKIPMVWRFVGWPVAGVCFTSMLFITKRWNSGMKPTLLASALYFSFSRIIYVAAIGWLVVCCTRGYGGVVNYILSLKIWIPISRLSYVMYLMSINLQLSYFSNLRMVIDSNRMSMIWRYMADLVISCLLALAMVVVIESPFIAMEKLLFQRKSTDGNANITNNDSKMCNGVRTITTVIDEKSLNAIELEENTKNTMN